MKISNFMVLTMDFFELYYEYGKKQAGYNA
jgi:hypothetical protein